MDSKYNQVVDERTRLPATVEPSPIKVSLDKPLPSPTHSPLNHSTHRRTPSNASQVSNKSLPPEPKTPERLYGYGRMMESAGLPSTKSTPHLPRNSNELENMDQLPGLPEKPISRTHQRAPSNGSQFSFTISLAQESIPPTFNDFDGVHHPASQLAQPPLPKNKIGGIALRRIPSNSSQLSTQLSPINTRRSFESLRSARMIQATSTDRTHSLSSNYSLDIPPSERSLTPTRLRAPIVYPALLSRVALAFRQRITLNTRNKDSLSYTDCFDGREAVDVLAQIIRTTDRNLALLVGRALDSQKFFHDVTYDHRLRDSATELYRLRENVTVAPPLPPDDDLPPESPVTPSPEQLLEEEGDLPNGVFTLLTDCYSPTCTRSKLCYSIACPRRLEQQARLNLGGGLNRSVSQMSNHEVQQDQRLWIHSVPKEIADSVSSEERKRQENIFELIYTEKDFVSDMEYLREFWIRPLLTTNIIPEDRRDKFVHDVFYNILEVHAINARMCDALQKRQNAYAVVDQIGDLLLDHVVNFEPFVRYGAHQMIGKYVFERERAVNQLFAQFVHEIERRPESRKLELNGYLTKPTTRLARYNLLLGQILKHTPEGHPDHVNIPRVMEIIREFLNRVNVETGKTENRFNLEQLHERIVFKAGSEPVDLHLLDSHRQLILKGPLNRKGGDQNSDLQVFLFDHMLVFTKIKIIHKFEQYRVHKYPIPLELLQVSCPDQHHHGRRPSSILPYSRSTPNIATPPTTTKTEMKTGYPIMFVHLGRKEATPLTLYAPTQMGRRQWLDKIEKQRKMIFERTRIFATNSLSEKHFPSHNKVNCSTTFENGKKIIYGTNFGLSVGTPGSSNKQLQYVLTIEKVSQVEVIEEARIVLVLADRNLYSYPLEILDPDDTNPANRRGRRISSHVSFFKYGTCMERNLICVVKSNTLSTTIKALEPQLVSGSRKSRPSLGRLLRGGNDNLRIYKILYIPTESTSIHFLKTKLCVGCTKGFEIVDLETLNTQGLLDPDDESLHFAQKRENVCPIAIYRVRSGEFLLCYDEFAFYVDKNGRRTRRDWLVSWEGRPTAFAFLSPFVVGFEPRFIEVWNVYTGVREQVIQGTNIRCLTPNVLHGPIHAVMDDGDWQYVFSLSLSEKGMELAATTIERSKSAGTTTGKGGWKSKKLPATPPSSTWNPNAVPPQPPPHRAVPTSALSITSEGSDTSPLI
ncbi:uncharacterized protein VTP21DRAFT_7432 [Calcarisporiella thermophila]|uniref:uncharacterized protein n=1 Tax=Calcarisporiella thermophila TaxID=911321 RepID=UPI0037427B0C